MAGLLQPEQVSAGAYHKGKGAFTLVIKVDHHSGRAVMIVKIHMADVDLLLLQGMTHVAAKRVTADAADKSAVAAKAGNPYRHVSRRASRHCSKRPSLSGSRSTTASPRTQTFAFMLKPSKAKLN